jgi:hypothetical protein
MSNADTTQALDALRKAVEQHKAAVEQEKFARQAMRAAAAEALRAGVRQVDVVEVTGYTRETIRGIRVDAGLPPATRGGRPT